MPRVAYVSGRYVALNAAAVSIEDRGFQFADAVYEVFALRDGRLLDADAHMARLARSLAAIGMAMPMSAPAMLTVFYETVRRNRLKAGLVYLQITRGAAPRDHGFPAPARAATVVVTVRPLSWSAIEARAAQGIKIVTLPDLRWKRCDIKSTGLLPNVLAKQAARGQGAQEAWLVGADGFVTEGASSNAWIVDARGTLITRALGPEILPGVTRETILRLARERQIPVELRPFTVAEALSAKEAFISSATNLVMPVVAIDGKPVGEGRPGPVAKALRLDYQRA